MTKSVESGSFRNPSSAGFLSRWFRRSPGKTDSTSQKPEGERDSNGRVSVGPGQDLSADSPEALERVGRAAEKGDALAQNSLGLIFAYGQGALRSDLEARKWFRRAAEQGEAGAQFNLGNLCQSASCGHLAANRGEARIEAYMWFHLAAAQGHRQADASCDMLNLQMTDAELDEGNRRARAFEAKKEEV